MKNLILSINFGTQRTYLTVTERTSDCFKLHYLNTTSNTINLYDINSEQSIAGFDEIRNMLVEYLNNISKVFIVLDTNYVFSTTFPGTIDDNIANIKELLSLEIRQNFNSKNIDDFRIKIVDSFSINANPMLSAILISKDIIDACKQFSETLQIKITDIYSSRLAVANTFIFNYPEEKEENNLIVGLNQNGIELAIISDNKIGYYDIAVDLKEQRIPEFIENKVNQIRLMTNTENFKNLFLTGINLTKSNFFECWEIGALLGCDTKRLNPFRMFKAELDIREKEYCGRVFHLFSPCIGASLPLYFKSKVL